MRNGESPEAVFGADGLVKWFLIKLSALGTLVRLPVELLNLPKIDAKSREALLCGVGPLAG